MPVTALISLIRSILIGSCGRPGTTPWTMPTETASVSTPVSATKRFASGLTDQEVRDARAAGVCKFNADTDLRHAFRAGLESVFARGDRQLEEAMAEGRKRMVAATIEKMRAYGCAGAAA